MHSIHRQSAGPFFSERWRQHYLFLVGLGLLSLFVAVASADEKPTLLIGYTEGRNDLEGGQFVNWVTNRACLVGADGKGRKILAQELTKKEHSWTQFAGWSPDGKTAIIGSHWESTGNAAWEREHKTFRMTEGWLSDTCLLDLASGKITNVTAVDRVSAYNTGLFYLPAGKGFGFTPLIKGVSKPYVMDPDGKNKRDVSGQGGGFAYGYSASPDGKRISYHENYQVYIANADGGDKRKVETKNPFNFAPRWSPDGEWLLFVSGEHYNCHPHIVKKDGTGLKKLADRGGYRGVVEVLKHPDFHSESSDVPVWSADGRHVFYTARVGDSIELMRVDLDGNVTQLTKSKPGTRHYHPAVSPEGKWVLFGSDRSGTMQLFVATTDGKDSWPITNVPAGSCAMHGHWYPVVTRPGGLERAIPRRAPVRKIPPWLKCRY
jgi:TolB protein